MEIQKLYDKLDEQMPVFKKFLTSKQPTPHKKPYIPDVAHILAVSKNGVIGLKYDGGSYDMPWGMALKEDMKRFRKVTSGNVVIMGRNTFESIGYKPLPKRVNIVISSSIEANEFDYENLIICRDVKSAIDTSEYIGLMASCDVLIMGGAHVYGQTLPYINTAYVTVVDEDYQMDKYDEFDYIYLGYTYKNFDRHFDKQDLDNITEYIGDKEINYSFHKFTRA